MQGEHPEGRETRAFIAIDIPEGLKERLRSVATSSEGVRLKPVDPDNMHITLLFLGDLDPDKIQKVRAILSGTKARRFTISIKGLAAFNARRNPRIVFANVGDGAQDLVRMHNELYKKIRDLGVKLETRPYTPHLTVCRLRDLDKGELMALADFLDKNSALDLGSFTCEEIKFKSSVLGGEKPSHTDISSVRLTR